MGRLLLNLAAGASLLLLVLILSICISSADDPENEYVYIASFGKIHYLGYCLHRGTLKLECDYYFDDSNGRPPNWTLSLGNFSVDVSSGGCLAGVRSVVISAPLWQLSLICFIPPAIWLFKTQRRRTALRRATQHNLCRHCHYDLGGTTGDTCPECGTMLSGRN